MASKVLFVSQDLKLISFLQEALTDDYVIFQVDSLQQALDFFQENQETAVWVLDISHDHSSEALAQITCLSPDTRKIFLTETHDPVVHPYSTLYSYTCILKNNTDNIITAIKTAVEFYSLITQNKRLVESLTLKNIELKKLKSRHEDFIKQEKLRISQELHDETSQSLAYLNIKLEVLQKLLHQETMDKNRVLSELMEVRKNLKFVMTQVRRISLDLRPKSLDTLGFLQSVKEHIRMFQEKHSTSGLEAFCEIEGDVFTFDPKTELMLFRLIQEALNNTAKHAQAKQVSVKLIYSKERSLKIKIKDDGKGFETGSSESELLKEHHMGLINMKERVESIYGDMNLSSIPEQGTEISIFIPVL